MQKALHTLIEIYLENASHERFQLRIVAEESTFSSFKHADAMYRIMTIK